MDAMNIYMIKVIVRLEVRRVISVIFNGVVGVVSSLLIIAGVIYGINALHRWEAMNDMNNMLNSPNFTGVVTSRRYLIEHFRIAIPRGYTRTTYRLRILGEYIDGDERIPIDQYFIVSEEMFHRFQIGDVFTNRPPPPDYCGGGIGGFPYRCPNRYNGAASAFANRFENRHDAQKRQYEAV